MLNGFKYSYELPVIQSRHTVKQFQILLFNTQFYATLTIRFHSVKCFHVLLCITNNSIKHQSFVFTQWNGKSSISNSSV